MFTIGAFGVIINENNEVLLCHRRDKDLWDIPGGMVVRGESPWEGAVREVKEEVGLDVEIVRLVGVYSKKKKNDVIFSFLCKICGGEISLTDEADMVAYFPIDDLPKNLSPKHVERIMDAKQGVAHAFLKIQSDISGWDLVQRAYKKEKSDIGSI